MREFRPLMEDLLRVRTASAYAQAGAFLRIVPKRLFAADLCKSVDENERAPAN
jgi:hypothetical protein